MNLKELHSFKMSDAVKFHSELNPRLFNGQHLNATIRRKLLAIAEDFLNNLGVSPFKVKDITISGSNAAYSYTPHSDIDLHVIVDMDQFSNDEVYQELFNAKKTVYNDKHDITIKDIPVELYVQPASDPHVSLGEYSIMNDHWLKFPLKRRANFDQNNTRAKYEQLKSLCELALKERDLTKVSRVLKKIKQYRKAGLAKFGEFGPENLAYKMVKNQGYLQKLYDLRDKLHSEKLSFENMYQNIQPVEETSAPDVIDTTPKEKVFYHVTTTASVPRIKKRGILPLQPSNWVQAGTGERYGGGEIFAFDNLPDAQSWAGKMDWAHNTKIGTGKISIVKFTDDGDWEQDTAPMVAYKGNALKKHGRVKPENILDVEPFTSESVKSLIASNKITEERTTLQKMYGNKLPDQNEIFWNYVSTRDLKKPLVIKTMPKHKVKIHLLGQYRVEHIDELVDRLDDEQMDTLSHYISDPDLSDKVIVIDDGKIIDGQHRALAAAIKDVPIKYVDLAEPLEEVTIDNVKGWGAVPHNQDVDYFGLRVKMRPSIFLKLAAPTHTDPDEEMTNHIKSGGAIGAPFLYVLMPEDWEKGDYSMAARIGGHEGRHRMKTILKHEGDDPVEVHLFPMSGYRNRHLTPEIVDNWNKGLYAEKSRVVVPGPLFSMFGNTQSVEDLTSEIKDGEGLTESHAKPLTIGINVRSDGDIDYADLIVDGKKKYETRNTDSLRSYVGKTVGIIRTGNGPSVAIGQATIGEPIVADEKKFNKLRKKHLVPKGSKFDIDSNGTKYLYPIIDPVRWDNEKVIKKKGIVARKIDEQDSRRYENYNGINMFLQETDDDEVYVIASVDGKELGHVLFVMDRDYLLPQDLEVEEKYRGQGIATAMYDFVKSKGYKIRRSGQQTDDGAKFWAKHRPKQNFWEQETAEASEDIPKIVYHVTPTKNIKSIAKEGLKPGIGDRSNKIMREKSGIYVFPSRLAAEDAVMNWLGDEFEDEPLTMLKIDTSGLEDHISKGAGYELIIDTIIEPNRIKKVNISLEEASGYIPSYAQRNDPRYKTALTVDVHPDTMRKNAKRFGNKISRAGIPPTARPDGKV